LVLVAGGSDDVALRLGVAMVAMQAGIGTANDLIDEPGDQGLKLGKPLPRGLLSRAAARWIFVASTGVGLALSAVSGPAVLSVAVAGVAVGLVYDRWLKGTIWSWAPFAVGLPLLPVYTWLGATGRLPAAFDVLLPAAFLAGAALAVANVLADEERDAAAGAETIATRLGSRCAFGVSVVLHAIVAVIAVASLVAAGGRGVGLVVATAGIALIALGLAVGRRGTPLLRERAWELQATGVGLLAAGWVAALAEAGDLRT
jgi:geranylgeranylglycerol-phosphate geranylgeranyltransferase